MLKQIIKYRIYLIIFFNILFTNVLANYSVYPIHIKLEEKDKIADFNLINKSNITKNFHLVVHKIENPKDKSYTETEDLFVSPLIFKVEPNDTQLIRFKINEGKNLNYLERGYRVIVKELPPKITKNTSNRLSFIINMEVPLTIVSNKTL